MSTVAATVVAVIDPPPNAHESGEVSKKCSPSTKMVVPPAIGPPEGTTRVSANASWYSKTVAKDEPEV